MKALLSIILLFISFSALSQKATTSAQQTITLRLVDISVLEKPWASSTASTDIDNAPIQVHSAKKWITITNDFTDIEGNTTITNTSDFVEFSETTSVKTAKIVTLSKI